MQLIAINHLTALVYIYCISSTVYTVHTDNYMVGQTIQYDWLEKIQLKSEKPNALFSIIVCCLFQGSQ